MASARRLTFDEYAASWAALHGGVDPRRAAPLVLAWLRLSYLLSWPLAVAGVAPGVITALGLGLSLAVPVLVLLGAGWVVLAAVLVLLAAVADSVDGAVAMITSRVTRLGVLYDAVADRVAEACWLIGLWLLGAPGVLVTACGALAWLHEYARAVVSRSGQLDLAVITVAERPTRVAVVTLALLAGGVAGLVSGKLAAGTVTVMVAAWLILGVLGAARLAAAIRTAANRSGPV